MHMNHISINDIVDIVAFAVGGDKRHCRNCKKDTRAWFWFFAMEEPTVKKSGKGRPTASGLRALFSGTLHDTSLERIHCLACSKSFAPSYLKTTSKLREHVSKCPALSEDVRRTHGVEGATPKKKRSKQDGDGVGDGSALGLALEDGGSPPPAKTSKSSKGGRGRGGGGGSGGSSLWSGNEVASLAFSGHVPALFIGNPQFGAWLKHVKANVADINLTYLSGLDTAVTGISVCLLRCACLRARYDGVWRECVRLCLNLCIARCCADADEMLKLRLQTQPLMFMLVNGASASEPSGLLHVAIQMGVEVHYWKAVRCRGVSPADHATTIKRLAMEWIATKIGKVVGIVTDSEEVNTLLVRGRFEFVCGCDA